MLCNRAVELQNQILKHLKGIICSTKRSKILVEVKILLLSEEK